MNVVDLEIRLKRGSQDEGRLPKDDFRRRLSKYLPEGWLAE